MKIERFKILGQVPSKSNCYRVVLIKGHGSMAKTPALRKYEQDFFMQCPARGAKIANRFRLSADVFYPSDRSDLDNSLKTILDCLQACKTITNDRLCCEIHARKFVDKLQPRVEIEIETM